MNETTFSIGDNVRVRAGVADPDFGHRLGRWQGWIIDISEDEAGGNIFHIAWDSQTLSSMPMRLIRKCERVGLRWHEMNLGEAELELATPRDEQADRDQVIRNVTTRLKHQAEMKPLQKKRKFRRRR